MSYSKKVVADPEIVAMVVSKFCEGPHTVGEIAEISGVRAANVAEILNRNIPNAERLNAKRRNYRRSKLGAKNPARGRRPVNYKGQCGDGYGYLTMLVNGKRQFFHRIVFANALGIDVAELPSELHIHHIDENKQNNSINNLALVSSVGHRRIHALMCKKPSS